MSNIGDKIKQAGAIKKGKFKLSDGSLTDYYIDKYVFETQPEVLTAVASKIATGIDTDTVDVIAGPELGAVPLVTAVSIRTGIPCAYIRKGQKHHGTQARVEGNIEKGQQVAIIEDVSTTGNTIIETAELIKEVGGVPASLTVVVDRNDGAVENVMEAGFELNYLAQIDEDSLVDSD